MTRTRGGRAAIWSAMAAIATAALLGTGLTPAAALEAPPLVPLSGSDTFDGSTLDTFALAIDRGASAVGVEWRVIYDDFSVARAVNERLAQRRIIEVANTSRNRAGDITNINWHGPLVNHFHIDLAF